MPKSLADNPAPSASTGSKASATWRPKVKDLEQYERSKAGKYTQYFQGNTIFPTPEVIKSLEPKILSLVITDLRTKTLARLREEKFNDLLQTCEIPCRYFCRQSYATWDILLPTETQVKKLAEHIITKFYKLQSKYMDTRQISYSLQRAHKLT